MTGLLLDTHGLLWSAADDARAVTAMRQRTKQAVRRFVSEASAFEIATKVRVGKLPGGDAVLIGWVRLLRNLQAEELPLSAAHMARAGALSWEHRDPFDRMLVAQAQLEGLGLLTDDRALRDFGDVRTVWD